LDDAWKYIGFSKACIAIMSKHRSKFLWPELTRYLLTQVEDVRVKMIGLLLLLDINYDPGLEMSPLTEIICARPQITKYLLT
jgi:hypothetical protein